VLGGKGEVRGGGELWSARQSPGGKRAESSASILHSSGAGGASIDEESGGRGEVSTHEPEAIKTRSGKKSLLSARVEKTRQEKSSTLSA